MEWVISSECETGMNHIAVANSKTESNQGHEKKDAKTLALVKGRVK